MKLLSLAPLAVFLLQVALGPAPQQRPQGSIEGSVTRQGSGQPVPAAQVRLTRRGGPGQAPGPAVVGQPNAAGARGAPAPIAPVVTDDRGRFSFPSLEEGTYVLQVAANGYVIQPYGQRFPNGPGTPIPLTSGQAIRDIQINLMPAANISGRVRDTTDQSLINVPVQLLRYSSDSTGQRTYQSVGITQTNDRGEYRMYWVTPGRYYLVAGRSTTGASPLTDMMMSSLGGLRPNGNAVPPVSGYVFYPGVTEIVNARVIDLQPGADLQAVDLALPSKPRTYSIRGKLIDSRTGQPPPRANVFVATQTPGASATGVDELLGPNGPPSRNYNAPTGTFEIRELLPGTYNVIATVQDTAIAGRGGPVGISSGMVPTSISSSDVDGLVLSVVPAGAIPGRLRVEGQLQQGLTIDRVRIRPVAIGTTGSLQRTLQSATGSGGMATVNADGTFRLNNVVPGDYRIEVFPPIGNLFLKEVRFEGADALNTPLRYSGASNAGLDVTIATGGGRIDGILSDARSQPVPSTRVVIVPERSRYRSDLYKVATTDQNGRFLLSGVAPGDYKIFSWESIEENGWFDLDILSRSEARGRSVRVTETSVETIDIRIIPAEGTR